MKKFSLGLLTTFILLISFAVTAFAADDVDFDEKLGWTVEYNGEKLTTSANNGKMNDTLNQMQPGDSVQFTVNLKNTSAYDVDFWMSNEVMKSFEESGAAGGAYEYKLTYTDPKGTENVLYSNETVGGDEKDDKAKKGGLYEATDALKDFFFLDTFAKGDTAQVVLYVKLDGLSQGNDYQKAESKINLNFAIEDRTTVIKTGDTQKMLPFFIGIGASGIVLIGAVILLTRKKSNVKKGGAKS